MLSCGPSQHLGRERDDLHEVALAQFAGHRPEHARAARVVLVVDDHGGVLVEGDVGAVVATDRLLRAHDHSRHDLALFDRALRVGLLDGGGYHVADESVTTLGAALDADAEDFARAGVVGHAQTGLVLDHRARSSTSTSAQRFMRESGLLSITRTTSPSLASLFSS